jgi:DNA-binding NtrC family response regulator
MLVGILEDNQAVAEVYQLAMSMEGYESRVFALPTLFIHAVIHAAPWPYDMLLCDLALGTGRSRVDAIKAIRASIPDMPAMMISGSSAHDLEKAQRALPDVPVMQKPVPLEALFRTIERLTNCHLPHAEEIHPLWFAHPMDP